MKKNKLIIADLDGTLFDTVEVNYRSYKKALNEVGYDLEREYYAKSCNGRHYKEYLPTIIGTKKEKLMEQIHDRKKELYSDFLYTAQKNQHLFGILEALKEQYYLAVVTTASRRNAEEILDSFHVRNLFDVLITHEDVAYVKPDPEGFLKAMDYFGVTPQNTMIFEDSLLGIEAAAKSKTTVFVVNKF